MIRPQIANAVLVSILFASLTGGAALLVLGGPAMRHVAGVVEKCDIFPARH
jgi:hypothetical protein